MRLSQATHIAGGLSDDRDRGGDCYAAKADVAAPGQHLHAFRTCQVESRGIGRIDIAGHGETLCRRNLNDKKRTARMPLARIAGEFAEMFRATLGHAIGELGEPAFAPRWTFLTSK